MPFKRLGSKGKSSPRVAAERLLKIRPRSIGELRSRLSLRGFEPEAVDHAINRLKKAGLLDDAAFASWWIGQRTLLHPAGVYRLRQELRAKRIDRATIDQAISASGVAESELELAAEALKGRLPYYARLDRMTCRRRLAGFLSRRGFANEVISIIIKSIESR